jgi:hypothetical protein
MPQKRWQSNVYMVRSRLWRRGPYSASYGGSSGIARVADDFGRLWGGGSRAERDSYLSYRRVSDHDRPREHRGDALLMSTSTYYWIRLKYRGLKIPSGRSRSTLTLITLLKCASMQPRWRLRSRFADLFLGEVRGRELDGRICLQCPSRKNDSAIADE